MGGQYEDTIEAPRKSRGKSGSETIGKIRFHESRGEVHFHDDDAKLKVAMPVHVWSEAWAQVASGARHEWSYIDGINGTALDVELTADKGKVDVDLTIGETKVSDSFKKLQKFTEAV